MSLPEGHPEPHSHDGGICPVTGQSHDWCPPQQGDSRSPCPALNTLANHGYIRRDGKQLSATDIVEGLMECYNLSKPLALFLSHVGFLILGRLARRLELHDISRHGKIEHDASLVHADTPKGETWAPIEIHQNLVDALLNDVEPSVDPAQPEKKKQLLVNECDVAKARVRREKQSPPLGVKAAEIARGEMGIILGVFENEIGDKKGIPIDWLREWIGNERMPKDFKPTRVQTLSNVKARAKAIRLHMVDIRRKEAASARSSARGKVSKEDAAPVEESVSTP